MDVKTAVRTAREFVGDLFSEEGIVNLGLEEVRYDDEKNEWLVTIGFARKWNTTEPQTFERLIGQRTVQRDFKVVRIDDESGRVLDVTNREVSV